MVTITNTSFCKYDKEIDLFLATFWCSEVTWYMEMYPAEANEFNPLLF